MFKYHMHFEKHFQYLENETVKGFTSDIYFKKFEDAFNLIKKYKGNNMYNIRIHLIRKLATNSKKYRELAGYKFYPGIMLMELDNGVIMDYRLHTPRMI